MSSVWESVEHEKGGREKMLHLFNSARSLFNKGHYEIKPDTPTQNLKLPNNSLTNNIVQAVFSVGKKS